MERLVNHGNSVPSISKALAFRAKALVLQTRRAVREASNNQVRRHAIDGSLAGHPIIAESRTALWTDSEMSEKLLVAGKVHNLRRAIRELNGVEVPAARLFSFWKQVGCTSRLKGYVAGRELREGCLIPKIGGGLCQLSNALYDAALLANFEIVERHAHTRVIPGSLAEIARDATVFWNYVDLRFRSRQAFRIEASLTADSLVVRFRGELVRGRASSALQARAINPLDKGSEPENCFSCGTQNCFRRVRTAGGCFGRTAYLLDEYWPEFDRYISDRKGKADLLCIPLDGKKFGKPTYHWNTEGFGTVKQSSLLTLKRSYQSRRYSSQGANRQKAWLAANDRLAQRYASFLSYDVTHVTLMQQFLPFLWREGHLGGRTFDVLMTSLPLATLQQRLDAAFKLHPESPTLADFRANAALLDAERKALQQARKIITPHTEIAALYPDKSALINWEIPAPATRVISLRDSKPKLVFPAGTLGRKGVYELRSAIGGLNIQLLIVGPILEGKDFWDGMQVEQIRPGEDWLAHATAVVLPSFVENRPRLLLEAIARGVPVIASENCGLKNVRGVINVPSGDIDSLRMAIEKVVQAPSLLLAQPSEKPSNRARTNNCQFTFLNARPVSPLECDRLC